MPSLPSDFGSVDECTGMCCERFPLGNNHEEVMTLLESGSVQDGFIILNMITHIPADDKVSYSTYTCKHWNKDTRKCGIYATRPFMCSDYPYDKACRLCGAVSKVGADENYL